MNTAANTLGSLGREISSTENWTVALSDPTQHLVFLVGALVAGVIALAIVCMVLGQLCLMPARRCSGGYAQSQGRSTGAFWIALGFIVFVAVYYGSQHGGHGVGVQLVQGLLAQAGPQS